MDLLYHQSNQLLQEINQKFVQLEQSPPDKAHLIETDIHFKIDQLSSNCDRLDIYVSKEPPQRRPTSKLKVDQLKYDCQHLNAALRNLQNRRINRESEAAERSQLLTRKFTTNQEQDTAIFIDHSLRHNESLTNAHKGMDELIGSGGSILTSMREQRMTLKGTRKKILDVANTLGLSTTVMRLIERRSHTDKLIFYGGCALTLFALFLIWRYLA